MIIFFKAFLQSALNSKIELTLYLKTKTMTKIHKIRPGTARKSESVLQPEPPDNLSQFWNRNRQIIWVSSRILELEPVQQWLTVWDCLYTLTRGGEYRKYQREVEWVPKGAAKGGYRVKFAVQDGVLTAPWWCWWGPWQPWQSSWQWGLLSSTYGRWNTRSPQDRWEA